MGEKDDVSGSIMVMSEESFDSLCPMVFSVSCAFFALGLLPEPEICDNKWSEIRTRMLQGSAHLLGLLVWRVQRGVFINGRFDLLKKLECAQKQILELKKRRSEEAKANEKVVSIFAAREQSWFDERRQLRQQIDVLMNDLRVVQTKKDQSLSELSAKVDETQVILQLKDKIMEEVEQRRREAEEKLKTAENLVEELKMCVKTETERHSCEVSELVELVSNHRQLEVEMSWALGQVEVAKQEVDSVMEEKEQLRLANEMLSVDLLKIRKDLENKDRILLALLRKSKDKQMLIQEVKLSSPVSVFKHLNPKEMAKFGRFRLKDENLEACQWRLMRMELESKRFQAQIEGLQCDISQLRQDNVKLEGTLLERKGELQSLKERLMNYQKVNDAVRCKGKVFRRKLAELKRQEMEVSQDIVFTLESPIKEVKEVKAYSGPGTPTSLGVGLDLSKTSNLTTTTVKMDIHSLGVSYKIKRLKQQLIILHSSENEKGLCAFLSTLNKLADRYESLQRKIDDLCKKMHGDDAIRMEQFLEETFQLQRYIVATGQKLMEVQTMIASSFDGVVDMEMKQFGDSINGLVKEVQRGLELQVSRIIGDLEGTLTS